MNGYPKEIFYNHVKKFLSEKLMTTNSCQNMNDENHAIYWSSIHNFQKVIKKKTQKALIKNVVQYLKHLRFKTTFLSKMKLHWPYKQMSFIFLKVLVIITKPTLVKQKGIWQLGLGSIFQEIHPFMEHISSCNACNHSTIENFHILPHGNNDLDNKVKEALYIKKQKPLLNKHLHQHGASFMLNVF